MNFVTVAFVLYFTAVFVVYWRLDRRGQSILLLASSLYFYAQWDWRFLGLIILSALLDFVAGRRVHLATTPRARRGWLLVSLIGHLGILSYFKYFNFFAQSLAALLESFGIQASWTTLNIVLPVGVSFYSFHPMTYTLDIYRRQLKPVDSLLDFGTFVAFFPQLVAGPIVRASEFLYQLEVRRTFQPSQFHDGLRRFLLGFFKKAFVADYLALHVVDPVFTAPAEYSTGSHWLALLGYTTQIYCDFSGYSSMAVGSALMLGLKLPENFNFPYLATSMSDFWRRWHMSMSRFFRDYVYVSLGGNRKGMPRTVLNLAATTLLSGLWHGANWTFVVWGGLHGVFIAINQVWRSIARPAGALSVLGRVLATVASWVCVQSAVWLAWVIFRSTDFHSARVFLGGLFESAGTRVIALDMLMLVAFVSCVIDHLFGLWFERRGHARVYVPPLAEAAFFAVLIVFMFHAIPKDANPFIYFQF